MIMDSDAHQRLPMNLPKLPTVSILDSFICQNQVLFLDNDSNKIQILKLNLHIFVFKVL